MGDPGKVEGWTDGHPESPTAGCPARPPACPSPSWSPAYLGPIFMSHTDPLPGGQRQVHEHPPLWLLSLPSPISSSFIGTHGIRYMGPFVPDSCLRDFSDVTLEKDATYPFHSIQFHDPLVFCSLPVFFFALSSHESQDCLFLASALDFSSQVMFRPHRWQFEAG